MSANKRKFEGNGTLPGMDEEGPKPVSRPRVRAASAPKREIPTWRIAVSVLTLIFVSLVSLFVFHTFEQFLIRDTRFALNGVEGDRETLEVSGAAHASERQIEAVFSEDSGKSVYLLPLNDRRATLRAVDWVKDASIVRLWPNRVLVRVNERVPIAFVAISSSKFGLIDEDGVILPPAADRFALPVLAGVRSSDAPTQRRDRVHRMMKLTRDIGEHVKDISEIDVSDPDNLRVTQPFDGHMITLLLGDHNFKLRYENFLRNFPEIKKTITRRGHFRFETGRQNYGGGVDES